ncbi:low molecular weight protein arginine phosphatase [Verrucomicrobiota bacterium]
MNNRIILFICAGNICRSPMAEYMLRERLKPDSDWTVSSAGLAACLWISASYAAIDVLAEHDIDMGGHKSKPVNRELVDEASLIVVMTLSQHKEMRMLFPDAAEKVFYLRHFDPEAEEKDIIDPIGASIEVYREIYDKIDSALPGLIEFLKTMHVKQEE